MALAPAQTLTRGSESLQKTESKWRAMLRMAAIQTSDHFKEKNGTITRISNPYTTPDTQSVSLQIQKKPPIARGLLN